MFSLELELCFLDKAEALRFFKSIKPELEGDFLRSKMVVSQKEDKLGLVISASDKTALRASLNSVLKPLMLFEELDKL